MVVMSCYTPNFVSLQGDIEMQDSDGGYRKGALGTPQKDAKWFQGGHSTHRNIFPKQPPYLTKQFPQLQGSIPLYINSLFISHI